jgi:hypothetical protein
LQIEESYMDDKFIAWRNDAIHMMRDLRTEKRLRVELLTSGRNGFHEVHEGQVVDKSGEFIEKLEADIEELERLLKAAGHILDE